MPERVDSAARALSDVCPVEALDGVGKRRHVTVVVDGVSSKPFRDAGSAAATAERMCLDNS